MKRILAIVRASTERQETETQKRELFQYLNRFGFSDDEIEVIESAGASARKANTKYKLFLETIKSTLLEKGIKAVGLWSLDRLGRQESYLHQMKEFFVENHIQCICKIPEFVLLKEDGTEDPNTGLTFSVFAAMVKMNTDDIFMKTKRGKRRNSENKKFNGGSTIKFGYKLDENKYVVPNHEKTLANDISEVELVQMVFDKYASGKYSLSTLRNELDSLGYKQRNNKPLTIRFLFQMLSDTSFIGYKNKDGVNRNFDPIIEKELFDKVQAVKNGFRKTATLEHKHQHLCTKLIKCGCCGYHYTPTDRQYICISKLNDRINKTHNCTDSKSISLQIMDDVVWFFARQIHTHYLQNLDKQSVAEYEKEKQILLKKQTEIESKLEKVEVKRKRAVKTYNDGDFSDEEYNERMAQIKSEKQTLEEQKKVYERQIQEKVKDIDNLLNGDSRLRNMYIDSQVYQMGFGDFQQKREIVTQHIEYITISNTTHEDRNKQLIEIKTFKNGTIKLLYDCFYRNNEEKKLLIWRKDKWESFKGIYPIKVKFL